MSNPERTDVKAVRRPRARQHLKYRDLLDSGRTGGPGSSRQSFELLEHGIGSAINRRVPVADLNEKTRKAFADLLRTIHASEVCNRQPLVGRFGSKASIDVAMIERSIREAHGSAVHDSRPSETTLNSNSRLPAQQAARVALKTRQDFQSIKRDALIRFYHQQECLENITAEPGLPASRILRVKSGNRQKIEQLRRSPSNHRNVLKLVG